jgi:hypothetical protein
MWCEHTPLCVIELEFGTDSQVCFSRELLLGYIINDCMLYTYLSYILSSLFLFVAKIYMGDF